MINNKVSVCLEVEPGLLDGSFPALLYKADIWSKVTSQVYRSEQSNPTHFQRNLPAATSVLTVDLYLLNEKQAIVFNRNYRSRDYATDVISFPAADLERQNGYCGEIIICTDVCITQAAENGHPPINEIIELFIHGLLHLWGYDHENSDEEEKVMLLRQSNLTKKAMKLIQANT